MADQERYFLVRPDGKDYDYHYMPFEVIEIEKSEARDMISGQKVQPRCTEAEREFLDALAESSYGKSYDGRGLYRGCPVCDYDGLEPKTHRLIEAIRALESESTAND